MTTPQDETKILDTEEIAIEEKEVPDQSAEKISQLEEQVLRLSADLQNIRRRAETEKIRARFEGSAKVVLSVAKTIDDLHRAFAHLPEDIAEHPFMQSLQAVEKNLQKTMNAEEITFFAETGDVFDEKLHESLLMDPSTTENTIAQVFEKGITLKGEVIRHAKVSVGNAS